MPTTDHNRQAMTTVRRHLRAALEALPLERRRAIMRTLLESMIAGIDGEFGTDDTPTDDSAGWHDGAAPIRRPAYMVHPKAIGELDEREAAREGCGEFPHDPASEELRIMTRDWEC
jgi:hypothetical protein